MTAEGPVAYRTRDNDWLCSKCWMDPACVSATPYYISQMAGLRSFDCRNCGKTETGIKGIGEPGACVFCDIVAGRAEADWIVQPDHWPDAVAFVPLNPVTEGHCLVVPKAHVQDFAEDPEVFAATARRAAELMRFTPRPMAVLTLRGEEAGQEIPHLHLHLIPREAGDGLRIISRTGKGRG